MAAHLVARDPEAKSASGYIGLAAEMLDFSEKTVEDLDGLVDAWKEYFRWFNGVLEKAHDEIAVGNASQIPNRLIDMAGRFGNGVVWPEETQVPVAVGLWAR